MLVNVLENPVSVFLDANGQPLQGGSIYIGQPNTDPTNPANQITVYQDQGLSIPLQQPIKTTNGQPSLNGQQIPVYIGVGVTTFSLAAINAGGVVVMSQPNCAPFSLGGSTGANMTVKEYVNGTDFTAGTTAQLPLPANPGSGANMWLDFDGTPQHYPDDFTLNATNTAILFANPIPVGTNKVYLKFGTTNAVGTPGNGTVVDATVAAGAAIQSSKLSFLFPYVGAVARTVQSKLADTVNVLDFGATPGGSLNTALADAVAYLASIGGGTVFIPASEQAWTLSQTIVINNSDIKIVGAGHGSVHDVLGAPENAATVILWNGTSGGTMISITPAAGAAQALAGCGVRDLFLYGNGVSGTGVALLSHRGGVFDFAGYEFLTAQMSMSCFTGLSEAADSQHNEVSLYGRQLLNPGNLLNINGISNANTSFNRFKMLQCEYANAPALYVGSADNNVFETVHFTQASGGTAAAGILLDASAFTVPAASNMFIDCSPGNAGVYAAGTERNTYPSVYNSILFYDKGNGPPNPVSGTGAILYWSSNYQASIGRRADTLTSGANWYVDSAGRFHVFGITASIAPASTGSFTLPAGITVTTGISNIHVTPRTNSIGKFSAVWTGSQVNINNGDTVTSTDFWIEVVGF